ncbi:MAG TPA: hypothetical protein VMU04_25560, partial [Candidatus Acidoferrum sp.]|nr:hypothetical protein [Candidatus Acidoferrum sp.]
MSSGPPTPAMTFELRFEEVMVPASQVGVATTNSPLVVTPAVAGTFTWLSPRSGAFTPTGPLTLDTRYELRLRPGLQCADGRPSKALLFRTLSTPPFGLCESLPRHADPNATSSPEVKLAFNADVRLPDAEPYLYFHDDIGRRIPADARHGIVEEALYVLGGPRNLRTWAQEFEAMQSSGAADSYRELTDTPTNELPNVLIVTPRQPLPLGKGWRVVVGAGLPAQGSSLRLPVAAEVPIGDITPFVVTEVTATHYVYEGPRIRFSFSKPVPDLVTNGAAGWLEISPAVTNLDVQTGGRTITLNGGFKGDTWYTLKLSPSFESTEPFKLSGTNSFTLKMPRVAPRLYFPDFSGDQLAGGNRTFPLLTVNVPLVRVRAKLLDPQTAIHALRGYGSYFATYNQREESGKWD